MRRSRLKGWAAVAATSIVANLAWLSAGRRFPNGPIGRLNRSVLGKRSS